MQLEKNPKTRNLYRRLLRLGDRVTGASFPKMKRVKQITVFHCGPAVIEALFSFLGVRVSQTGVVKSLRAFKKIKRIGLSVKDLARATHALGHGKYVFWKKANSKISDIETIITKYKFPVGVEWQGVFYEFEDEDNGHYCIVTKVDREGGFLRLSDPFHAFSGIDRKLGIKFFTQRWWDTNLVKGRILKDRRMLFVVVPQGQNWPKKLGMVKAN
jgi:hypothetical protein